MKSRTRRDNTVRTACTSAEKTARRVPGKNSPTKSLTRTIGDSRNRSRTRSKRTVLDACNYWFQLYGMVSAKWRSAAPGSASAPGPVLSDILPADRSLARPSASVVTARKHDGSTPTRDQRERFCRSRKRLSLIPWRVRITGLHQEVWASYAPGTHQKRTLSAAPRQNV